MIRLFSIFWSLGFFVLAGSAIVAALTLGRVDAAAILAAAAFGAVAAVPAAWIVARKVAGG